MSRFGLIEQYLDNSGKVLIGGKLYFYESGTTTPITTYSDVSQTTANTNPVILGADGRMPDIFFTGSAKVVLTDENGVQLEVVDPAGGDSLSAAEVKTLYESNDDTNAYTDSEKSKLAGVETSANNYSHPNHTGDVTSVADGTQTLASAAITGKTTITTVADDDTLLVSDTSDSGNLKEASAANIRQNDWSYDSMLSGDYIGTTITLTSNEAISLYDACHVGGSGGVSQCETATEQQASIVGIALNSASGASESVTLLIQGVIKYTTWSWSDGLPVFSSSGGAISQTRPSLASQWSARVGIGIHDDVLLVSPCEAVENP